MTGDDRDLLEDVLARCEELRVELRRLRTGDLVARLSDREREEIAQRVFELVDAQLLPDDDAGKPTRDPAPRRRPPRRRGLFG